MKIRWESVFGTAFAIVDGGVVGDVQRRGADGIWHAWILGRGPDETFRRRVDAKRYVECQAAKPVEPGECPF